MMHALWCVVALSALAYPASLGAVSTVLGNAFDRVAAFLVLLGAQILAVSFAVGALLHAYRPVPLMLGCLAVAGLVFGARLVWIRRHGGQRRLFRPRWPSRAELRSALTGWGVVPVALLGGFVALQYAWHVLLGVRLPYFDWDGLMYHLISPDMWIIDGRIEHTTQIVWADAFPANTELLTAFPAVFAHDTGYVFLTNLPFHLLGACAVAGLALRLGAGRVVAAAAGLGLLAFPAVVGQVQTAYVDVPGSAFALAGLSFALLVPASGPLWTPALLAGCAAGVSAGAKPTNVVYAGVVIAVLMLRVLRRPRAQRLVGWLVVAGSAVLVVLLGGYWYLRNWVHYGNPLYPVATLGLPGRGSLQSVITGAFLPPQLAHVPGGMLGATVLAWLYGLWPPAPSYDVKLGGFGAAWPLLIVPAAAVGAVLSMRRQRFAAMVLALAAMLTLVTSPYPWWPRFTLVLGGIGLVFAAVAASRLTPARGRLALCCFLALCVVSGIWANAHTPVYTTDRPFQVIGVGETVRLLRAPDRASRVWPWSDFTGVQAIPRGQTIAVVDGITRPFTHPFVGSDLRHRLVLLPRPTGAVALGRSMRRADARYVALDRYGEQVNLANELRGSPCFRAMSAAGVRPLGVEIFQRLDCPASAPPPATPAPANTPAATASTRPR
jgi:hypothetical protein